MSIEKDLADVINTHGYDAKLGIPDYKLAKYLMNALDNYAGKKDENKTAREFVTETINQNPTETKKPMILHGVPAGLDVSSS